MGSRTGCAGHFVEILPNARLVIDMTVVDGDGAALFNALTTVSFENVCGGTQLDVEQRYTLLDPVAGNFTRGAAQGWAETLDRLEVEVARMADAPPAERSVVHGIFRIERTFKATPAEVFRRADRPRRPRRNGSGVAMAIRNWRGPWMPAPVAAST